MARIVANPGPLMWVPVDTAAARTILVGSIVADGVDGVNTLGAAAGAFDTTGKDGTISTAGIPLGVVVGTNEEFEVYDSTYKVNKTVSVITSNANYSRTRQGVEGPWGKGDKQAYVQIASILPTTLIRFPIYNAALGTAPTVATVTVAGATGVGCTTGAVEVATVAGHNSLYCRNGANMGLTRVVTSASDTTHTFTSPFPYGIVAGDKFVKGPKSHGHSILQLDATSSWVDNAAACTSDYFHVIVQKLDMSVPGGEYVDIIFGAFAFMPKLA